MNAYTGGNTTGFVSPASDSLEGTIDLSEVLDLRRPSRYLVRVSGDALMSREIMSGDVLVVNAAQPPSHDKVAVVMMNGTTLIAQLTYRHSEWWIQSGCSDTKPVKVEGEDAEIWAIAVGLVRTEI